MAVIRTNLFSMNLKQNMECYVLLPEKTEKNEKLKTIWLYHGGSGDHTGWLYHTKIVEYVEEHHFAAILPNVHESCFVNMNLGKKYGTYVGDELIKTLQTMFPILSDKREDNYICGFSNGGYGCIHVALTYPEKFYAVGAFSAGDKADSDFLNDNSQKALSRIRLFGTGDLNQNAYGLKYLANQLIETNAVKPEIYHACGSNDPWLDKNLILRAYFENQSAHFNYTYDQIEGAAHEWKFWEEELKRFLVYEHICSN